LTASHLMDLIAVGNFRRPPLRPTRLHLLRALFLVSRVISRLISISFALTARRIASRLRPPVSLFGPMWIVNYKCYTKRGLRNTNRKYNFKKKTFSIIILVFIVPGCSKRSQRGIPRCTPMKMKCKTKVVMTAQSTRSELFAKKPSCSCPINTLRIV
jgi:hypothetical protein